MKIAHVIATLDPVFGGPPVVAASLAAAQSARGLGVSIISCVDPSRAEAIEQGLGPVPGLDRVERRAMPPFSPWRAIWPPGGDRALRHALADADVVHFHGVWEPMLAAGARLCRLRGQPYVVSPHGMLDRWGLFQKRLKKQLALALWSRRMLNGSAFIHCLSISEREALGDVGVVAPVRVIPNGIFERQMRSLPPRGRFVAAYPQLEGKRLILFLGRLHHVKGLEHLAEAFARIALRHMDAHLVVVGPDEGAQADFERRIHAAGLASRVLLTGPLYGQAKYEALVDACCFCLPSRLEGFSIAITEAVACGVPVVISEGCRFPEVAQAGAGRIVPLDSQRIADALEEILSDPALAERMGRAGRALVFERYTWEAIAAVFEDAYRAAAQGATGAARARGVRRDVPP